MSEIIVSVIHLEKVQSCSTQAVRPVKRRLPVSFYRGNYSFFGNTVNIHARLPERFDPVPRSASHPGESGLPVRYERPEPPPNPESQASIRFWSVSPFRIPPAIKVSPIIDATNIRYSNIASKRAVFELWSHADGAFDGQVKFHCKRRIPHKRAVRPMALNKVPKEFSITRWNFRNRFLE